MLTGAFHRICSALALSLMLWACSEPSSPPAPELSQRNLNAEELAAKKSAASATIDSTGPSAVWVVMKQAASVSQFAATRNWKTKGEQVFS
ncbi:MAG TPA: hypothetical protein VMG12_20920, partial [Polyangiaceae bacterium]|nr:hypothetical protein [Polyangiaceae bacterium]